MIRNTYNVPKKLWKSFKTKEGRRLFNSMMKQMVGNQHVTVHPKTPKMPKDQWRTICHNSACYAVWALEHDPLTKGQLVKDIDPKTKKVVRTVKAN